eukprot:CAMPEP_0173421048 /NCGR_PEP_ID=MMETSP1357-20121228/2296_1 /TAXON_ID=77926 /ORGANISM="Hemiselmis rufescens, Strain PCC563" /LENGTH=80 /DNA_ID=CAMNT_0014383913 /DNA_START=115 /DNA_END=353 /DNA_ORIENTATION=+
MALTLSTAVVSGYAAGLTFLPMKPIIVFLSHCLCSTRAPEIPFSDMRFFSSSYRYLTLSTSPPLGPSSPSSPLPISSFTA